MYAALIDLEHPLHLVLDAVLSPEECARLVARVEDAGPKVAPISLASGPVVHLDTRNNTRVMLDDPALASLLFERVRARVPGEMSGMRVVGANERLRFYKYQVGQRFRRHYDGAFHRSDDERSLLTFMVYLNEGFRGGETAMLDLGLTITPRTGRALLFQHHQLHEGCEVTQGTKYVVRSDVMYRRIGAAAGR